MSILKQLHTFDQPLLDVSDDCTVRSGDDDLILYIAKKAVGRAYRYHGIQKERQTMMWDEMVQEALVGVYASLGRTAKQAYHTAVWHALRFIHQRENNPEGIFNQPRLHESYEAMVEQLRDAEFEPYRASEIRRPTENEAIYNLERATRSWQSTDRYWEDVQAQLLLESAAAAYDASSNEDDIWHKTSDDLFTAFCLQRDAHQLKPLSLYCEIIVKLSRGFTHEDIYASLNFDDPIRYMNLVNLAFQSMEELSQMSAEERTTRMQANRGLVLHYLQLEQDMSPLLDDRFKKHILIFPFGPLSMTKMMSKGKTPQLVGKFEMQYFIDGDWKTGHRKKVGITTPPLATLTYAQLRDTALRFVDKIRTAAGDEVAREFFGPAVLQALLSVGGAS